MANFKNKLNLCKTFKNGFHQKSHKQSGISRVIDSRTTLLMVKIVISLTEIQNVGQPYKHLS
jgi:hypothetical protein